MSPKPGQPQIEAIVRGSEESYCQTTIENIGLTLGIENPQIKAVIPESLTYENMSPRHQFFRDNLVNYFENGQGRNLSVLHGRNVLAPTPKVGWGHLVQISGEAHDMANTLGVNVFLTDPVDLLSEKEKKPYSIIQDFLKVLHSGGDINAFVNGIGTESRNILDKLYYASAKTMMRMALTSRGIDEKDTSFIGTTSKAITDRLSHDPKYVGAVFQAFVTAEIILSEMPFSRLFEKIIPVLNPAMIISAHSGTVRSLDRKIKVPALSAIPDDGYGPKLVKKSIFRPERVRHQHPQGVIDYFDEGENQLPFVPGAKLFGERKNMVYTVPTKEMKDSMELLFNPDAPIVVAGTLTETIEPNEFVEKWNQPNRNILVSTMGNAHNMGEIQMIVNDFIHASPERTTGFKMVVFLGEHSDQVIGEDLLGLLKEHPEIEVVRTKDKIETAKLKGEYTKKAHMQIRSGGENALDNGNMGCVPVCTLSNAENETYNTVHSWRRGVALPSSYPAETYQRWVETLGEISPTERDAFTFGNRPFDNFVDYLDYLFGEDQLARNAAVSGYINSNPLTNLHVLMLSTQLMLNKVEGRDDITHEEIDAIGVYMEGLLQSFKEYQIDYLKSAGFMT